MLNITVDGKELKEIIEKVQCAMLKKFSMISKTQRYKCIGNGWTVDVIVHIFRGLMTV